MELTFASTRTSGCYGRPLSVNSDRGVVVMKSKYYVRVMHPTFQRAILTVEPGSEETAVLEMVFSREESEGDSEADDLEYVRDGRYAYALLQADLDEGEGSVIAPMWLRTSPESAMRRLKPSMPG